MAVSPVLRSRQPTQHRSVTPLAQLWMHVTPFASAIPVAVAILRFARMPQGGRLLLGWLGLTLALDVFMLVVRTWGTARIAIVHLSLPVFCTIGLLTLAALSCDRRYHKAAGTVGAFYLLAWSLVSLLTGIQSDYSIYAQPLMNLILTGAAAALIVVRLVQIQERPLHDPVVLIGLGTLVTFAPSVAITPVAAVIAQSNRELAIQLFFVRSAFVVLGIILYTLALLWIPPPPSSSGS